MVAIMSLFQKATIVATFFLRASLSRHSRLLALVSFHCAPISKTEWYEVLVSQRC